MRSAALLTLAAATAASAGTVAVEFQKLKHIDALVISKRDTITLEALNNISGGGYYAEFEIGTPGQKLSFHLDTGSSDTWVNSVDTNLCNSETLQSSMGRCFAVFNPDKSSTFEVVDEDGFSISYLDGRKIQGDYFNDTVTIGKAEIKNQQLGIAKNSTRTTGLMGLGFSINVASRIKYPTVVDNMVSQGLIDTPAFSLYLNDLESDSGTVLFGGIDKAKFIGDLVTLPLIPETTIGSRLRDSEEITHYNVALDGFSVDAPKGVSSLRVPRVSSAEAVLDSGSTICLMPKDLVEPIWDAFGVIYLKQLNVPFVDCKYRDATDGSFDFKFGGKTISVPVREMAIDSWPDMQDIFQDPSVRDLFEGWQGVCMFGIADATNFGVESDSFVLLGDTFLRSAYVVYDLANKQVGMAQANLRTSKSDIVEIKSGDSALPKVTGVASQEPFSTATSTRRPVVTVTGTAGGDDDSAAAHRGPGALGALLVGLGAAVWLL